MREIFIPKLLFTEFMDLKEKNKERSHLLPIFFDEPSENKKAAS